MASCRTCEQEHGAAGRCAGWCGSRAGGRDRRARLAQSACNGWLQLAATMLQIPSVCISRFRMPRPPHLGCEGSTGVPRPGEDQSPLSRGALAAAAAGGGTAAATARSAAEAGSRASAARRDGAGEAGAASSVHREAWLAAAAGCARRRRRAPAGGGGDRNDFGVETLRCIVCVVLWGLGTRCAGACLRSRQTAPRMGGTMSLMPASCSDRHLDSGLGSCKRVYRVPRRLPCGWSLLPLPLGCRSQCSVREITDGAAPASFPSLGATWRKWMLGGLCRPPRLPPATQHHCINHEHTPGHGKRTGREMAF